MFHFLFFSASDGIFDSKTVILSLFRLDISMFEFTEMLSNLQIIILYQLKFIHYLFGRSYMAPELYFFNISDISGVTCGTNFAVWPLFGHVVIEIHKNLNITPPVTALFWIQ